MADLLQLTIFQIRELSLTVVKGIADKAKNFVLSTIMVKSINSGVTWATQFCPFLAPYLKQVS